MYIINNKGYIFNTECISEITSDGVYIYAVTNGTPRPISRNFKSLKTIEDALRNNAPIVEVE